jgi:hypothetical protein
LFGRRRPRNSSIARRAEGDVDAESIGSGDLLFSGDRSSPGIASRRSRLGDDVDVVQVPSAMRDAIESDPYVFNQMRASRAHLTRLVAPMIDRSAMVRGIAEAQTSVRDAIVSSPELFERIRASQERIEEVIRPIVRKAAALEGSSDMYTAARDAIAKNQAVVRQVRTSQEQIQNMIGPIVRRSVGIGGIAEAQASVRSAISSNPDAFEQIRRSQEDLQRAIAPVVKRWGEALERPEFEAEGTPVARSILSSAVERATRLSGDRTEDLWRGINYGAGTIVDLGGTRVAAALRDPAYDHDLRNDAVVLRRRASQYLDPDA